MITHKQHEFFKQVHCRMSDDLWSGQKNRRNRLVCIIRIADHGCKGNSRDPPTAHQSDSLTEALIEVDVNVDLYFSSLQIDLMFIIRVLSSG